MKARARPQRLPATLARPPLSTREYLYRSVHKALFSNANAHERGAHGDDDQMSCADFSLANGKPINIGGVEIRSKKSAKFGQEA
jgi:hypothetical protein